MFPCKDCPKRFRALSAGGLKLHQKKCQASLKRDAEANRRRKAIAALDKAKQEKLNSRKAHLGSAAPGVGVFVITDQYYG